jgi:hypothetical protein
MWLLMGFVSPRFSPDRLLDRSPCKLPQKNQLLNDFATGKPHGDNRKEEMITMKKNIK